MKLMRICKCIDANVQGIRLFKMGSNGNESQLWLYCGLQTAENGMVSKNKEEKVQIRQSCWLTNSNPKARPRTGLTKPLEFEW